MKSKIIHAEHASGLRYLIYLLTSLTYWFPSPKQSKRCGSTWTTYGSNSFPSILQSISKANSAPEQRQTCGQCFLTR